MKEIDEKALCLFLIAVMIGTNEDFMKLLTEKQMKKFSGIISKYYDPQHYLDVYGGATAFFKYAAKKGLGDE